VEEAKIKERAGHLRALGHKKRQVFYQNYLGKRLDVLVEGRQKDGEDWKGLSRNYIPVFIKDEYGSEGMDWANQEVCAEMVGLGKKGVIGKRVWPGGHR
jgi:tRNA A37 methylthiotransferase MiaB